MQNLLAPTSQLTSTERSRAPFWSDAALSRAVSLLIRCDINLHGQGRNKKTVSAIADGIASLGHAFWQVRKRTETTAGTMPFLPNALRIAICALQSAADELAAGSTSHELETTVQRIETPLRVLSALVRGSDPNKDSWPSDLALDALRALTTVVSNGYVRARYERRFLPLVEEPLEIVISLALQNNEAVPKVFDILIALNQDVPDGRNGWPEPFRMVHGMSHSTSPLGDVQRFEERARQALNTLVNGTGNHANRRSNALQARSIRMIDALRDWGLKLDPETMDRFGKAVSQAIGDPNRSTLLDPWEWLMIKEVAAPAQRYFNEWAFGRRDGEPPRISQEALLDETGDLRTQRGLLLDPARNLANALSHGRVKYKLIRTHAHATAVWLIRAAAYAASATDSHVDRRRDLLTTIFTKGIMPHVKAPRVKDEFLKDAYGALIALHSINAKIEGQIPAFAAAVAGRDSFPAAEEQLASLLRKGLASAGHENDTFDLAVAATVEWIKEADPKDPKGTKPPKSLLGALAQTLAYPESTIGHKSLGAIATYIDYQKDLQLQDASLLLPSIRFKLDELLLADATGRGAGLNQEARSEVMGSLERIVERLEELEAVRTRATEGTSLKIELDQIRYAMHTLTQSYTAAPNAKTKSAPRIK